MNQLVGITLASRATSSSFCLFRALSSSCSSAFFFVLARSRSRTPRSDRTSVPIKPSKEERLSTAGLTAHVQKLHNAIGPSSTRCHEDRAIERTESANSSKGIKLSEERYDSPRNERNLDHPIRHAQDDRSIAVIRTKSKQHSMPKRPAESPQRIIGVGEFKLSYRDCTLADCRRSAMSNSSLRAFMTLLSSISTLILFVACSSFLLASRSNRTNICINA